MTVSMVLVLVLTALALLFIMQNSDVVQVSFLIWHISLSRALLILFSLLIGFAIGWFVHSYLSYRRAKRESDRVPPSL